MKFYKEIKAIFDEAELDGYTECKPGGWIAFCACEHNPSGTFVSLSQLAAMQELLDCGDISVSAFENGTFEDHYAYIEATEVKF